MGKVMVYTVLYTIGFILFYLLARFLCSMVIWHGDNFFYQLFTTIGYNLYYLAFIWILGFIFIVIACLMKTLSYIDSIVAASSSLVKDDDEWIILPKDLTEIEEKMNQVKQQSIRNQRLAKENEQKKNDLIVYLAHDIKTPLTSMIGYLSLLQEVEDMPKLQREKYINVALTKSYRLEELINELFDITRFNSSKIILEKEWLNLTLMLEQMIDDFYPTLKDLNKKINFESIGKIEIYGDSNKLARVFNNLIKNAIFYSLDDSDISIKMNKDQSFVTVVVTNKGKKIPDDKLKRIFEKFYRLDSSRTSKTGGSGLGLAIAKEIVDLHGGVIMATSNELETSFFVKLPLS